MVEENLEALKRWRAKRKCEVVLKILRGVPIDEVSREVGVERYRLEEWRQQALCAMEIGFKERSGDPLQEELARAKQRIGDLLMDNELLKEKAKKQGPFRTRKLNP